VAPHGAPHDEHARRQRQYEDPCGKETLNAKEQDEQTRGGGDQRARVVI
jgi:hypothetical protein